MRRFLARGIGALIGLPAGPLGVVFGFMVGTLVDQYRATDHPERPFLKYLSDPAGETSSKRLLSYVTCVCIGALLRRHCTTDQTNVEAAIDAISRRRWAGEERTRVYRRTREQRKRRIYDVMRRGELLIPVDYVDDIVRRGDEVDRSDLVEIATLLSELARDLSHRDEITLEIEDVQFLGDLIGRWGIDRTEVPTLEGIVFLLDEEACRMLGVPRTAGREEIKRSYRRLASAMHPDTSMGLELHQQEELHGAFVRIRSAYDRLNAQLDTWATQKR
jgi:hypothetical protein